MKARSQPPRGCTRRRWLATLAGACLLPGAWAAEAGDYVVVSHPGAPAPSRAQIAGAYLGTDPSLVPLDLALPAATRRVLYRALTGFELAQVQAQWARLVFTGRGAPPRELKDPAEMRRAVAADPRRIGYLPRQAVDDSVRVVLALD